MLAPAKDVAGTDCIKSMDAVDLAQRCFCMLLEQEGDDEYSVCVLSSIQNLRDESSKPRDLGILPEASSKTSDRALPIMISYHTYRKDFKERTWVSVDHSPKCESRHAPWKISRILLDIFSRLP